MLRRPLALGEQACRLDNDVGPEIAPRQIGRVPLGEDLERRAVDDDRVALDDDLAGKAPEDRVVAQQMGERLRIGQVVDRTELDLGACRVGGAEDVATDSAEAVDCDLDCYWAVLS